MKQLVLIILCACIPAMAAWAEVAKVSSGEHDGFSRLVVELPNPGAWQVGRTADGYALAVTPKPAGFDLAGVFDLIGRGRLADLSVDERTGNLEFVLACACHAIPFEFRPGVIVIDLRDGPPSDGSAFEAPLPLGDDGVQTARPRLRPVASPDSAAPAPEMPGASPEMPVTAPDDPATADAGTGKSQRWVLSPLPSDLSAERAVRPEPETGLALDRLLAENAPEYPADAPLVIQPASKAMAALRDDLLVQISRGAARGVVDIPADALRNVTLDTTDPTPDFPLLAVDPLPGMTAATADDIAPALTAKGAHCIDDESLDLPGWGQPGPVSAEIATLTSGIVGEFDQVQPEPLTIAIRYALYLGFGQEAAQLAASFPAQELAGQSSLWTAMGLTIDGRPDPANVFQGMQGCDTAAALWAMLGDSDLAPGTEVNAHAILRSFSALPVHLRRALGPRLADRLLALGLQDEVHAIREAIERAPEGLGADADLIGANLMLETGDPEKAEVLARGVVDNAGPRVPEAMLALVKATLAQDKPVDLGTTAALAALQRENHGAPLEAPLAEALILALASNGQAMQAFDLAEKHADVVPALWSVLASLGTDDDLLALAIRSPDQPQANAPATARMAIAQRLLTLGFPDAALQWLGPPDAPTGPDADLLHARAMLLRDPKAPVDTLPAATDPALRADLAAAALARGDARVAAKTYADLKDPAGESLAHIRARDWAALASSGAAPWQAAASTLSAKADASAPLPPLAEAAALLAAAAETRTALDALLADVARPISLPQAQNP